MHELLDSWREHGARMGKKRSACRILVGEPEEMRLFGKPRFSLWECDIKISLQKYAGRLWSGVL